MIVSLCINIAEMQIDNWMILPGFDIVYECGFQTSSSVLLISMQIQVALWRAMENNILQLI